MRPEDLRPRGFSFPPYAEYGMILYELSRYWIRGGNFFDGSRMFHHSLCVARCRCRPTYLPGAGREPGGGVCKKNVNSELRVKLGASAISGTRDRRWGRRFPLLVSKKRRSFQSRNVRRNVWASDSGHAMMLQTRTPFISCVPGLDSSFESPHRRHQSPNVSQSIG